MPNAKAAPKASKDDALAALGWLEEDANQLRVAGHGSLEREANLLVLRDSLDKTENSRVRVREGQPWPVTAEAGSYEGTEYAQPTGLAGVPNDAPVIEGDPHRDRKAVLAQVEADRKAATPDDES